MLRMFLLFAVALVAAHAVPPVGRAGSHPPGPSWERLTFPGEEFSVEWPDRPFVFTTKRKVKYTVGEYEDVLYFGTYSEGVAYRLVSFHNPRPNESLAHFVEQLPSRDSAAGFFSGEGVHEVEAGGVKGVEYDFGRHYTGAARVFRTQKRIYVLEAFSRDGPHEGITRFLNSLTLGPNPRGRAIEIPTVRAVTETPAEPSSPGAAAGEAAPPPRHVNPDGPFSTREVEEKAIILLKLGPGYTEEARKNRVQGLVRLRAILSSSGKVTNIQVIKGLPDGLTELAVRAANCIQFFPARKGGRPVSQWVTFEYNFNVY